MKQRRVLARFRFKGQTIYVENVPAWVCNRCGEQYFDAPIYKRLEEIAQQPERIQRVISFRRSTRRCELSPKSEGA
jgi:YgiT-type zinc finger domain-containing protein